MTNLNNILDGVNLYVDFINENPNLKLHLKYLIEVINQIKDNVDQNIILNKIGRDFSFELIINVRKDVQGELFSDILNMKNNNEKVSEISISLRSLENILSSIH